MKPYVKYEEIEDRRYDYSATPEDTYRPYKIRKKHKSHVNDPWCAPEHGKFARNMERAYRVDVNGRKMVELGKELILEQRPTIMIPERIPIFLGLDANIT